VFASGLPLVVLPGANASDIQRLAPERIIAANCGTCHGFDLMGGTSWVNGESTNQIAGLDVRRIISVARSGLLDTSMPAFGRPRLTDAELAELARYISIHPQGVPVPSRPQGRPVQLNIEDETPWFQSDGTDLNTGDRRRLVLAPDQYVHEINHGQTWHTVSSDANLGKDSGWIGLNGTFDAVQGDDLAEGCNVYHCHIHPYMQVEICVGEARPKPLTRIYKNPLDYAPDVATYGEDVLVAAQTQHTDTDNRNGYLQVISTTNWTVKKVVPNVVNNVHFPFWGKDALGKPVVMLGTFHDNKVTSLDPATYQVIGQAPIGVTSAHVMPLTDGSGLWASMLNGGDAIVLLDPVLMENVLNPIVNTIRATPDQIQDGPHGMWPCSPGYGNLFLAGNMFSNTISLWAWTRECWRTGCLPGASCQ
jgi:cytochrome c553